LHVFNDLVRAMKILDSTGPSWPRLKTILIDRFGNHSGDRPANDRPRSFAYAFLGSGPPTTRASLPAECGSYSGPHLSLVDPGRCRAHCHFARGVAGGRPCFRAPTQPRPRRAVEGTFGSPDDTQAVPLDLEMAGSFYPDPQSRDTIHSTRSRRRARCQIQLTSASVNERVSSSRKPSCSMIYTMTAMPTLLNLRADATWSFQGLVGTVFSGDGIRGHAFWRGRFSRS